MPPRREAQRGKDDLATRVRELSDEELFETFLGIVDQGDEELLAAAREEMRRRGISWPLAPVPTDRDEASGFSAAGHPVVCPHKASHLFTEQRLVLNARGLTFLNLDRLNRSAVALVCCRCGLLQWFAEPPQRT